MHRVVQAVGATLGGAGKAWASAKRSLALAAAAQAQREEELTNQSYVLKYLVDANAALRAQARALNAAAEADAEAAERHAAGPEWGKHAAQPWEAPRAGGATSQPHAVAERATAGPVPVPAHVAPPQEEEATDFIEHIVEERVKGSTCMYKVHWAGTDVSEDEWFSRQELLEDFPAVVASWERAGPSGRQNPPA